MIIIFYKIIKMTYSLIDYIVEKKLIDASNSLYFNYIFQLPDPFKCRIVFIDDFMIIDLNYIVEKLKDVLNFNYIYINNNCIEFIYKGFAFKYEYVCDDFNNKTFVITMN